MDITEKLSNAIQIPTVSSRVNEEKPNVFDQYIGKMEELFPLVHKYCELKIINNYSLLYRLKGKSDKDPIALTAHYDVVPIEESTADNWKYPSFSGKIRDDFIWGRGALDTKITMIGILDAAESLLSENIIPERDIYMAFGHDEEPGGYEGAAKIVEYLQKSQIDIDYLIDEGGCVTLDAIGEVNKPVAVVGIAEKGSVNIELSIRTEAGHSSTPPKHTSVGLMAQVINNLEKNQMPMSLEATKGFFKKIGPEMKGFQKIIVTNLWLFGPLFKKIFSKTKNGNALLRTTTAATMISGSMEPNVMPEVVTAVVNFRVASHETIEDVLAHIKKINKKYPLELKVLEGHNPSKLSDSEAPGYKLMEEAITTVFGDVLVAPYLTLARTDAAKYEPVAKNMYRFAPYKVDNRELSSIHSVNERISIKNVYLAKSFYTYIMKNC